MTLQEAGFEIFAVTADKGIRAWGPDAETALCQAALGLWSLMVEPDAVEGRHMMPIAAEADNRESLAVAWLNELLYLYEVRGFVGTACRVVSFTESRVDAEAWGESVDLARHVVLGHVKAVTHHQSRFGPVVNRWEVRVVVDV